MTSSAGRVSAAQIQKLLGTNLYKEVRRLEPLPGTLEGRFVRILQNEFNRIVDIFRTGKFSTSAQVCTRLDREVTKLRVKIEEQHFGRYDANINTVREELDLRKQIDATTDKILHLIVKTRARTEKPTKEFEKLSEHIDELRKTNKAGILKATDVLERFEFREFFLKINNLKYELQTVEERSPKNRRHDFAGSDLQLRRDWANRAKEILTILQQAKAGDKRYEGLLTGLSELIDENEQGIKQDLEILKPASKATLRGEFLAGHRKRSVKAPQLEPVEDLRAKRATLQVPQKTLTANEELTLTAEKETDPKSVYDLYTQIIDAGFALPGLKNLKLSDFRKMSSDERKRMADELGQALQNGIARVAGPMALPEATVEVEPKRTNKEEERETALKADVQEALEKAVDVAIDWDRNILNYHQNEAIDNDLEKKLVNLYAKKSAEFNPEDAQLAIDLIEMAYEPLVPPEVSDALRYLKGRLLALEKLR